METNLFTSFGKGKKNIRTETNECVIYTRVSGAKQMDGLSLETQLKGTDAHAKKHNLLVREHFGGTYESAASDERKEFQRMIKYLKSKRHKISKILVYSLERFSRNENSIWLSAQLRKLGIEIVSVTQPIDTSNPAGIMQQKMLFMFGEFDNELRRQKSMAGVKERLLSGVWCAKPPVGYDAIKMNGSRSIVTNEAAKIIKKMFLWKANERMPNVEIKKRISVLGLKYDLRRIAEVLSNPFYCGMLSHSALEGEVVEGKHEKIISKEIFLTVNGILAEKKHGLQTKNEPEEIALKRFVECSACNKPMRGYINKKHSVPYYKCNSIGCSNNRNANNVNEKFLKLLSGYQVDEKYHALIKEQLHVTFQEHNESIYESQEAAKLKMSDLTKKIERLEERYVTEEITGELYSKYKTRYEIELQEISKDFKENEIEMSNLDNYISFSLGLCGNLSEMWASGDYAQRQELQNSFFLNGITYDRKKDECRTKKVNEFLLHVANLSRQINNFDRNSNKKIKLTSVGSGRS